MDRSFTRVAVVQIAYHPAIVLAMRSPLEDPRGVEPLLPASADVSENVRPKLEELRGRTRAAYTRQLLARLQAILDACRGWGVRLVVFPEYSVPWDLLDEVAGAAGDMVVVAGTHMVDRDARRSGVYERLGWPKADIPRARQAVAPVLHGGKLLALSPKFHPATAVGEEIEPGHIWAPVAVPEGIVGPMGVMVCLDFLFRENQEHHHLVAEKLKACRFLAVPSLTRPHTVDAFAHQSWQEAQRYGRPVLYTNSAEGGGTSIFVDEEKHSGLRSFPEHVGCFDPGDEGVIVADVDLGYTRPGGSTRYDQVRPVRPVAAANFVYRTQPEGDGYARWLEDVGPLLARDDDDAVEELSGRLEGARAILRSAAALPGAKARKERIDRLYGGLRHVTRVEEIRQLTREVVMPAGVLPLSGTRAALARGAAEAVQEWMEEHPELGNVVKRLREAGKEASAAVWTSDGDEAIEEVSTEVRGDEPPSEREVPTLARRGLDLVGGSAVAHNGFALSFQARPEDFEFRLPADLVNLLAPPSAIRHASQHAVPARTGIDVFSADMDQGRIWEVEDFYRLLAAEGSRQLLAVAVRTADLFSRDGRLMPAARRTNHKPTIFVLRADGTSWIVNGQPTDREWMTEDRAAFVDALAVCGFEVTSFEFIEEEELLVRRARLLKRFEGGRAVLDDFLKRRLADVGGRFVEPDVEVNGIVQPGSKALDEWLGLDREPGQEEQRTAILLGEYGLGKSTLLAHWAAQLRGRQGAPLPLFVNLATGSSRDPVALLLQVARLDDTPANREALRLLVARRSVLPIFDGFDEMATRVSPNELPARLAELLAIVAHGGKVLLSSRDHYFATDRDLHEAIEAATRDVLYGPRDACRLVIKPFDDAKIRSLVSLVAGVDATDGILARLREVHDLEDLVHRPLLLGMVLSALDRLPKEGTVSRLDLYEVCVDRWLSQSGGSEPEIFTADQKQELAEVIAAELWRTGAPSCSLGSLRNALSKFPSQIFDSMPRMAEVLEATGGMFFVRAAGEPGDRYRFAHESFREYFFARALVRTLSEAGTSGVATALSTKRFTPEIVGFVGEILARKCEPKEAAAVRSVQRWLQRGRSAWEDDAPELAQTADAAANALRLLLELGRWAKEPEGWVPERADLRQIRVRGENFRGARLSGARLDGALLVGVELSDADLRGARLDKAKLSGATLNRALLAGMSARGADFTQVGADRADLTGADFSEAVLRQSMWTGCVWHRVILENAEVTGWATPGAGAATPYSSCVYTPYAFSTLATACWGVGKIAWSPDGNYIVSGEHDGGIRLVDAASGQTMALFDRQHGGIYSLAWRPGTNSVVSCATDGFVRLWDATTGRELNRWAASEDGNFDVAWNSTGTDLAAAGRDNVIRLWNVVTISDAVELSGHTDHIDKVSWSPDGTLIASASSDLTVRVWDVSTRQEKVCLKGHTGWVEALAWSPDGTSLVSGGNDGTIRIWDTEQQLVPRLLATNIGRCHALSWSPQGDQIASACARNVTRVFDVSSGAGSWMVNDGGADVAWSLSGASLVVANGGEIIIRDNSSREEIARFDGDCEWIYAVDWSPRGNCIAFPGTDGRLKILDVTTGEEAIINFPLNAVGRAVWHPTENLIAAVVKDDNRILIFDASSGEIASSLLLHIVARRIEWSADGRFLAVCATEEHGGNGFVVVVEVSSGLSLMRVEDEMGLGAISWSCNNILAIVNAEGRVCFFDVVGTRLKYLRSVDMHVGAISWHPDGIRMAGVGSDNNVIIWSPYDQNMPIVTSCHDSGQVYGLAWSPSGKTVASAGLHDAIRLWDGQTGKQTAELRSEHSPYAISWSPDSTRIVSAGFQTSLCVWNVSQEKLLCSVDVVGSEQIVRTPGGFCLFGRGDPSRYRLALRRPERSSRTVLYLPLAGLRDVLHRPDKVKAALAGDLSGDDLGAELARIGWNNGIPWDGEVHRVPVAEPVPLASPFESPAPSPKRQATMDIKLPKRLLEAHRNDKLALFVGSGLSLGSDVKGRFPTWSQLSERLLERCEHYESLDEEALVAKRARFKARMRLEDMLSELGTLRTALGRDYQDALNHIFRPADGAPGAAHRAVIELGTPALLTTNYDQLLEMVPETPRRQPYTWREAPKALGDLRAGRKVLLKVHGTAEHHETVVMSEVEYHQARADASYQAVLRYLLQEHVFLFVGYGMNDPLDLDLALAGNLGVFNDSAQRHYLLLKGAAEADCERYERTYNVRVIGYAEHAEVPPILARLAEAKEPTP
jgi:WD40 repeat protein/predicted amidohydrolase